MNLKVKSAAHVIGARVRRFFLFFLGGETFDFESASSPEALKASIRSSRDRLRHPGLVRVWGDRIQCGLPPDFMRRKSSLAFRGMIESTPTGSRIRGRLSVNLFDRLMLGLWFGMNALFSITALSTVIIPAVCLTLIWLAWHSIGLNEAEPKFIRYLSFLCAEAEQAPSPD